ncbi:radical SAM/SPASM domain-containing protein [Moorella sp. Hama-1]|uniref:radical SAM/SPASM domain-containing protein n=1 Tax=Moorella sp. Hama-1 TaxID=2138101 RepID=UPI00137B3682|nr:radical SAM protein [Moorella sp. Hama-1]BCV21378.1 radical SAM/SPASM domain-containing protein [Moorella sp. Hama-1]
MISFTKLLFNDNYFGDSLRYSNEARGATAGARRDGGPVVVWNCTRACNLQCRHCYAGAGREAAPGEMTTPEARDFLDQLVAFRVPVLLLSGGEPLVRPDVFDLMATAVQQGLRVTLSTNGTLIDRSTARELKRIGISYVGISLDGVETKHDAFRGVRGSFQAALEGIRNCLAVNQRVGLRFTISRNNVDQLEEIFYLLQEENIPRACFYHLVYSGRGSELAGEDLDHEESRATMDFLIDATRRLKRMGREVEILTVDNHADGIYLYLRLLREDPERAASVRELLRLNGGNRSGIAIGAVDWTGAVHPDQFTMHHSLGNVRERPFGTIWTDLSHPLLRGLRDRKPLLKGRCATCAWLGLCNGNCRVRAESVAGDFWDADPACYLTEKEIAGGELA